ncbi:NUDIX domain-containing protein [Streptomyces sp. 2A115]|uniref:NUDIX domain-containing protein n=1 Tax=Streptomyces sp. 2A115 TaxID=3457439 RepID=UPI003FD671FD
MPLERTLDVVLLLQQSVGAHLGKVREDAPGGLGGCLGLRTSPHRMLDGDIGLVKSAGAGELIAVELLRYDENGGFWAPGGSLEDGEDHPTATLRELREELGVDERAVELGVQLAERSKDHLVGGREVRQVEKYFLTHIPAAAIDPARASQPDNIREHRWWTLADLQATTETVYPHGLADLVTGVLEHGAPRRPVVLAG